MTEPCLINSFQDVLGAADALLLDMYGVLWNGEDFYPGVLKTLEHIKNSGKKICIVSNMTMLNAVFSASKAQKGLIKGTHYDAVVTSGDVFRLSAQNGFFEKTTLKKDYRLFNLGAFNAPLFEGFESHLTDDIGLADIVYVSGLDNKGIEEYTPLLEQALQKKLPAVCANPDVFFMHKNKKLPAQGALAKWYEERGGRVFYRGKPYKEIFEQALLTIGVPKERALMVGDMPETDIQGAFNAGIKSVLIVETGITGHILQEGKSLDNVINACKIKPDYIKNRFADD